MASSATPQHNAAIIAAPTSDVTPSLRADAVPLPHARHRWLKLAIKIAISAAIMAWILNHVPLIDIVVALGDVSWPYLVAAFFLQFLGAYITVRRWHLLLRTQSAEIPLRFLYGSWLVGCFFKQLLPSVIGADAVRVYDSHRAGASKSTALVAVGVDRMVGLLALLIVAVIALSFSNDLTASIPGLTAWILISTLGMTILTWLIFSRSVQMAAICRTVGQFAPKTFAARAERFFHAVAAYNNQHGTLVLALIWSLLLQLTVVTFYYLIALAMGFTITFMAFMLIVPIAIVVMMVPVTINGIGVREAMHVLLLGTFGVTAPEAIAFAWLEFGALLAFGLIGGVIYALRRS